jgi:probable HAF family extracellular repeat protein
MDSSFPALSRCSALLLGLIAACAHAGLPRYSCERLAAIGDGRYAEPSAINKDGRVVGRASFRDDQGRWTWGAVQWKDANHASPLDPLLPPGYTGAEAHAINDGNLIVGIAQPECDDVCWPTHPVAWHGTTATLLALPPGSLSGRTYAVNRHGRIVGRYTLPDSFTEHAAMWHGGRLRDLGTLGSRKNRDWQDSTATAVNDAGTIVGFSDTDSFQTHAARWDPDGQVHDLGGLPGLIESQAWSINSSGLVVGNSIHWQGADRLTHAVAWVDGSSTSTRWHRPTRAARPRRSTTRAPSSATSSSRTAPWRRCTGRAGTTRRSTWRTWSTATAMPAAKPSASATRTASTTAASSFPPA